MFDIRLRLADADDSRGRVLDTLQLSVEPVGSGMPTVQFTVAQSLVGEVPFPMVVAVEYSTGGTYVAPRDNLFIVPQDSEDAMDPSGTVSYTGEGLLPWMMELLPLWWKHEEAPAEERTYTNATAGTIIADIINHGQQWQGWGRYVTYDFTATHDSLGNPWAERLTQKYQLFTTAMSQVMNGLSEQGYIEWWTEGNKLRVVNAGTGVDRRQTAILGGAGFARAPRKTKYDPISVLVIKGDFGWTHVNNTGVDLRFGNLMQVMTQSGVATREQAVRNAQPALTAGRTPRQELSFDWTPPGWTPAPYAALRTPAPFADLNIGDVVTARTRNGKQAQRVIGMVVEKRDGKITARATVGDKLLSKAVKDSKRTAAAVTGQVIGGSGLALPPSPQLPGIAPESPRALRVTSNVGSWTDDGSARSRVVLSWDEVTQAIDATRIAIEIYELWSREGNEQPALTTRTASLSTVVDTWAPGVTRYVTVRARSRAGTWSEFSTEVAVTPATPTSLVPSAPTGLRVVSNVGGYADGGAAQAKVTIGWEAVEESNEGAIVSVEAYEVQLRDGDLWSPIDSVASTSASVTVSAGTPLGLRVTARSDRGLTGDPSEVLEVTAATPPIDGTAPSAPLLATGPGVVAITWDGRLDDDRPAPQHLSQVYAEAKVADGPWLRVGAPVRAASEITSVRARRGDEVSARLVWEDTLGRRSPASAPSRVIAVGLTSGDFGSGVIPSDAISDEAITIAKLAKGSVTRDKLTPGAVGNNEVADFALTAKKFNTNRHILF